MFKQISSDSAAGIALLLYAVKHRLSNMPGGGVFKGHFAELQVSAPGGAWGLGGGDGGKSTELALGVREPPHVFCPAFSQLGCFMVSGKPSCGKHFSMDVLMVLQAIALGADAVLLGRPVLYGLAIQGEGGVRKVLQMLKRELLLAMQLAGCVSLASITQSLILPFGDSKGFEYSSKM